MNCLISIMVTSICQFYVEPNLVMAIIKQESNFKSQAFNGGSVGLMQIMPPTAKMINCRAKTKKDLLDPEKNIECGCQYLSILKRKHKTNAAVVAAYNAGDAFICRKGVNCEIGKYTNQIHVNKVLKWEQYEFCHL